MEEKGIGKVEIAQFCGMKMEAVIFDMDGVLIDSEPLWRRAEVQVFGKFGIQITEEMCFQTTGMRVDEVVRFWSERLGNPETDPWELIEREMVDEVIRLVHLHAEPMHGVLDLLSELQRRNVPLALCSSSPTRLIEGVLDALKIERFFSVVQSAEKEEFGKPHPAVYLKAATKLGISPDRCVAIEDSVNGCISAKAAKMKVVSVPEPHARSDKRYGIADWMVETLSDCKPLIAEWGWE